MLQRCGGEGIYVPRLGGLAFMEQHRTFGTLAAEPPSEACPCASYTSTKLVCPREILIFVDVRQQKGLIGPCYLLWTERGLPQWEPVAVIGRMAHAHFIARHL